MDVPAGRVVIEMRPDLAPITVAHIKELVRRGFYNGIVFHRVIAGFMAQTGDPKGDGTGGSGHQIKGEFSPGEKHVRGTVSMARANDPNSGDSQFFIVFEPAPFLDGKYAIWGKVVSAWSSSTRSKRATQQQRRRQQARQDHQAAGRRRREEIVSLRAAHPRRRRDRRAGAGVAPRRARSAG